MLTHCCVMATSLFLLVFTYNLLCKPVDGASIIESPTSTSALLHSFAEFYCKGAGDDLQWTVENNALTDFIKQMRDIHVVRHDFNNRTILASTLTIAALSMNDGIEIGCVVATFNPYYPTAEEVTLTVKGVSNAENIQWDSESNLLTWSSPSFFSDDIENSTLTYNILINGRSIINTTYTSTHLNVSCEKFNVSIVVYTDLYVSQEEIKVEYDFGNYNITITNHTTSKVNNTIIASLQILVEATHSCNKTKIWVTIINDKNNSNTDLVVMNLDQRECIINDLEHHTTYTTKVSIRDPYNTIINEVTTKLSTYYVQNFTISFHQCINASMSVRCTYLQELTTKKCKVVFSNENNETYPYIINGTRNIYVSLPYHENYYVVVYDVLDDQIIGPAFELYVINDLVTLAPTCLKSDHTSTTPITSTIEKSVISSISNSSGPNEGLQGGVIFAIIATPCFLFIILSITVIILPIYLRNRSKRKKVTLEDKNSAKLPTKAKVQLLKFYSI